MALSQSIPTNQVDVNGNPVSASYWQWAQINIQQIPTQTCQITLLGYSSQAAFIAAPGSPMLSLNFNYPCQLTGDPTKDAILSQFPFDPVYIAANFSSHGILASQVSAQNWVLAMPIMAGATIVS